MFIRIVRPNEHKELLLNVNLISKIEIEYGVPGSDSSLWKTSLKESVESPDAIRIYRVYISGEMFVFAANPGDPVMKVFEGIYKNAIKG